MLNRLYHPFIILLCTSSLLSSLDWIPHLLCEQYRYRQWIRRSNIIIIVPDPPPGLSLSVARSADFPASREDCCCNFSSVWAVNNILCRAASHAVTDAHSAVISEALAPCLLIHTTLPLPTGGTRASWRGRKIEKGESEWLFIPKGTEETSHESPTMMHHATKSWVWGRAFHRGWVGGAPEVVMLLTGIQNRTVAFDVLSSPWRQQCDLWEVEPGGNVIVFIVGDPVLSARSTAQARENTPSPKQHLSFFALW